MYFLKGAIRIQPALSEKMIERLNRFLEIRHIRRNPGLMVFSDEEGRKEHSLFLDGILGEEGILYMPDRGEEKELCAYDLSARYLSNQEKWSARGVKEMKDMREAPAPLEDSM